MFVSISANRGRMLKPPLIVTPNHILVDGPISVVEINNLDPAQAIDGASYRFAAAYPEFVVRVYLRWLSHVVCGLLRSQFRERSVGRAGVLSRQRRIALALGRNYSATRNECKMLSSVTCSAVCWSAAHMVERPSRRRRAICRPSEGRAPAPRSSGSTPAPVSTISRARARPTRKATGPCMTGSEAMRKLIRLGALACPA